MHGQTYIKLLMCLWIAGSISQHRGCSYSELNSS